MRVILVKRPIFTVAFKKEVIPGDHMTHDTGGFF